MTIFIDIDRKELKYICNLSWICLKEKNKKRSKSLCIYLGGCIDAVGHRMHYFNI